MVKLFAKEAVGLFIEFEILRRWLRVL